MTAGRPSKYSEAYCNEVIEAAARGLSLTAFAAEIGVNRDTISEWAKVHEEFSVAVKIAKAKCAAWWEQKLRAIAEAGGGPGAATACIFGLKNMAPDEWREKTETEISGKGGGAIQVNITSDDDAL